jgi:hypothetical protein
MDAIKALLYKDVLGQVTRLSEDASLKPEQQYVIADSTDETVAVTLPAKAEAAGKFYFIYAPVGATNDVSILDKEAGTEITGGDLDADEDYALLFCTGYSWLLVGTSLPDLAVADSSKIQEVTVTATAITDFAEFVNLNKSDGALATTLAAPTAGRFLVIAQTDAGTSGHTVTLAAGTFDGTNEIATFNAANETLVLYGISATRFIIVENIGAVALSTAG